MNDIIEEKEARREIKVKINIIAGICILIDIMKKEIMNEIKVTIELKTSKEVKIITETIVNLAVKKDKGIIIEIEVMKEKGKIKGIIRIIIDQEEETVKKGGD